MPHSCDSPKMYDCGPKSIEEVQKLCNAGNTGSRARMGRSALGTRWEVAVVTKKPSTSLQQSFVLARSDGPKSNDQVGRREAKRVGAEHSALDLSRRSALLVWPQPQLVLLRLLDHSFTASSMTTRRTRYRALGDGNKFETTPAHRRRLRKAKRGLVHDDYRCKKLPPG